MKKEFIFVAILILFSSIAYSCDDSQVIVKLSGEDNAQAGLWNQDYPVSICYDNIFSTVYSGLNPHECNNNILFWLNSLTNSHASLSQDTNYNMPLCYGDLICSVKSQCNTEEKQILTLSDNTNAHFSLTSYTNKLCCRSNILEDFNATWNNMLNNEISEADLKDTVKLVVKDGNFNGKEINFTIYKSIPFWFDKKISQSQNSDYILWQAGKKTDNTFESGEYYFKAQSGNNEITSPNLNVKASENNSPPKAIILSPEYGQTYQKNNIQFTQASYDIDDAITTEWNFGDTLNSSEYNTTHSYTQEKQYSVLLKVKDARGLETINSTEILICGQAENSQCLFADIAYPKKGSLLLGRDIEFNATSTYLILFQGNSIKCLAGICPATSGNNIAITDTPNIPGLDKLEFNWTFYEKNDPTLVSYYKESGLNGAVFTKRFLNPSTLENPHKAKLLVLLK